MIIEDITEFLKKVPPFQFLDDASLRNLANKASMEFYPKGYTVLQQDGPPSEYLNIIKKGGVKVFIKLYTDEEVIIDYRSEGDSFGFLSLFSGDKSRANVIAVEDTIAYLLSKEDMLKLLDKNPSLSEYFFKSFFDKYIEKTFSEMQCKSLLYGGGDRMLFTAPVGELATKDVVAAFYEISIKEAADIMSKRGISSLILTDQEGVPVGIVTDRDLRDKVVARGRSVTDSIHNIMSVSLIKADARDYCFEALLKMIRYNIHHLLIVDNGKLKGVVTSHDLMMLQGTSPIAIAKEIESNQAIEGLVPVSKKIAGMIALLLKEGAKANNITRIITEVNDILLKKILQIAEKKFGQPPVSYCWIAFGSEGRKEQTFKTDQDNAVIYTDPSSPDHDAKINKYFSEFTIFVRDSLIKCGFPPCPADYMASNPKWCQPLNVWKGYFSGWLYMPSPEAILKSLIFFDFRHLFGDSGLADKLKTHLSSTTKERKEFFSEMADMITKNRPPLGIFKKIIVEKNGEHRNELNLKIRGIAPLVDIVRLFAIDAGIAETSTLERIRLMKDGHPILKKYADDLEKAFEFMTLLRIHNQTEQVVKGELPDNYINPDKLSNLEKKMLKESFHIISQVQDAVIDHYVPEGMRG